MFTRKSLLSVLVLTVAGALGALWLTADAADGNSRQGSSVAGGCPYVAIPPGVSMEITGINYLEDVPGEDGVGMRVTEQNKGKFRVAVVTVRVSKPRGKTLRIAAADLTLHYKYGSRDEVAPCEGISSLTRVENEDRPIKFFRHPGPGWVKRTTGPRASQGETVYFDAVFDMVEPEICEVWLCVGQPTNGRSFPTGGWRN